MSTLNIKDSETHRLAMQLAQTTGETLTAAVKQAVIERLARQRARRHDEIEAQVARWSALAKEIAAMPDLDPRSADEILGYNEIGTFDDDR